MRHFPSLVLFVFLSFAVQQSKAQTFTPMFKDPILPGGHAAWIDFDNDGDPDMLTSGVLRNGSGATVLYRNDAGDFVEVNHNFENFTGEIQVLDWEQDGDQDIFLFDILSNMVRRYTNVDGVFATGVNVQSAHTMKWFDYDGNGNLDMIGFNSSGFFVRRNLGSSFSLVNPAGLVVNPSSW